MNISVFPLPPAPSELAGRVCVVVDVIRASTVMIGLLEAGCETIYLSETATEALEIRKGLPPGTLLCGEGPGGSAPMGFDFEPSPLQVMDRELRGHTVVLATANGVPAALVAHEAGAETILFGALLNIGAVAVEAGVAARALDTDIAIVCSGRLRNRQVASEDVYCAGLLARRISELGSWFTEAVVLDDSARAAVVASEAHREAESAMANSETGQHFIERGQADDVRRCAAVDVSEVVPWIQRVDRVGLAGVPVVVAMAASPAMSAGNGLARQPELE